MTALLAIPFAPLMVFGGWLAVRYVRLRKRQARQQAALQHLILRGEQLAHMAEQAHCQHHANLLNTLNTRLRELKDGTGDTLVVCGGVWAVHEQLTTELTGMLEGPRVR